MLPSLLHSPLATSYSHDASRVRSLQLEAQPKKFAARSLLPVMPNGWQIKTGLVRTLSYLEDGTIVPLGLWGTDDVVGIQQSNQQQIECLTVVEAVPAAVTNAQQLSEILAAHLHQSENLMIIRSVRRIEPALVKLLGWLASRFGRTVDRGQLLELRLTHQDLAELLGVTRVTITRTLQQIEQQGLIERLSVRQILLHDCETWHYEI